MVASFFVKQGFRHNSQNRQRFCVKDHFDLLCFSWFSAFNVPRLREVRDRFTVERCLLPNTTYSYLSLMWVAEKWERVRLQTDHAGPEHSPACESWCWSRVVCMLGTGWCCGLSELARTRAQMLQSQTRMPSPMPSSIVVSRVCRASSRMISVSGGTKAVDTVFLCLPMGLVGSQALGAALEKSCLCQLIFLPRRHPRLRGCGRWRSDPCTGPNVPSHPRVRWKSNPPRLTMEADASQAF